MAQGSANMYMSSGPILPPIDDAEWFYGEDAGAFEIGFGMHGGTKLNEIPIQYLDWCEANVERTGLKKPLFAALKKYKEGLSQYNKSEYADVFVPFGQYEGERIGEVNDNSYFLWAIKKKDLLKKYPTFFECVRTWLNNSRHQGTHRDLGKATGFYIPWHEDHYYQSEDDPDYEDPEDWDDGMDINGPASVDEDIDDRELDDATTQDDDGQSTTWTDGDEDADDETEDDEEEEDASDEEGGQCSGNDHSTVASESDEDHHDDDDDDDDDEQIIWEGPASSLAQSRASSTDEFSFSSTLRGTQKRNAIRSPEYSESECTEEPSSPACDPVQYRSLEQEDSECEADPSSSELSEELPENLSTWEFSPTKMRTKRKLVLSPSVSEDEEEELPTISQRSRGTASRSSQMTGRAYRTTPGDSPCESPRKRRQIRASSPSFSNGEVESSPSRRPYSTSTSDPRRSRIPFRNGSLRERKSQQNARKLD